MSVTAHDLEIKLKKHNECQKIETFLFTTTTYACKVKQQQSRVEKAANTLGAYRC